MAETGRSSGSERRVSRLIEMGFNEIDSPGAYLEVGNGKLWRIPKEALSTGHSPIITCNSKGETRVAKLSEDPNVPVGTAARIAADNDYQPDF